MQNNSTSKTNKYRDSSRSDRNRGSNTGRKPTNVWTKRNSPTDNTVINEDTTEGITQKLKQVQIREKEPSKPNGEVYNDNQTVDSNLDDRRRNLAKEKKIMDRRAQQAKLSLAEFHNSVTTGEEEEDDQHPSRILWVGNIGPEVSEEELEQEFSQFGKLESLRILHNRFCAFVNFEEDEAAQNAKKTLHGTIIGSQYIVIHYRKPELAFKVNAAAPSNDSFVLNHPSRALWIGNVSDDVTEEELVSEFEKYGKIESIRLLKAKTCAFVNFTTVEEATNALNALQGKKLGNMAIKVNFGRPQQPLSKSMNTMDPLNQQYLASQSYGYPYNAMGGPADYYAYSGVPQASGQVPPVMFPPSYLPVDSYQMQMYDQYGYEQTYVPAYTLCDICGIDHKEIIFRPCGHTCCSNCANSLTKSGGEKPQCPWCRQPIQKFNPISYSYVPYPMYPMAMPAPTGGF